jgi:hypothetical protein
VDKQALRDHWALTEADLARARKMLPDHAASEEVIQQYQEFIDHNELQLACDMLETYARDHMVCREFWLALRDAATRMKLPDWADRYERCAANS